MAKRCPRGVVKSGPRKGRCKKKPGAKKSSSKTRCAKGRVTRGPRKGRCRK